MIFLKDVTKIYEINKANTVTAIENINLHIKEGELVVLKGVSGSGKSTILSLIAGLSKPTTGEVIVDNQRVSKLPDEFASHYRQNTIGFIFQRYNLISTLSVVDNIIVPIIPLNLDIKEVKSKIDRVLGEFDIMDKKDNIVRNLSGGEQQRVAISRALINNPKIIIADEPTANLDEKLSINFIEILKKLKDKNKTIIVATHDPLFFGLDIVDRIIEIKDGKII
jgi:putative ABC transport system ATP-binding protein